MPPGAPLADSTCAPRWREFAERALVPGAGVSMSMTAVMAAARVAATLRWPMPAAACGWSSRSRSEATAFWVRARPSSSG